MFLTGWSTFEGGHCNAYVTYTKEIVLVEIRLSAVHP